MGKALGKALAGDRDIGELARGARELYKEIKEECEKESVEAQSAIDEIIQDENEARSRWEAASETVKKLKLEKNKRKLELQAAKAAFLGATASKSSKSPKATAVTKT